MRTTVIGFYVMLITLISISCANESNQGQVDNKQMDTEKQNREISSENELGGNQDKDRLSDSNQSPLREPKPPSLISGETNEININCDFVNETLGNDDDLETIRDVTPFNSISIEHAFRVAIDPTVQAGKVIVRGDSNLHESVTTAVNQENLSVKFNQDGCYRFAKLHILVNPAMLANINLTGSSSLVTRKNLQVSTLAIKLEVRSRAWISGVFNQLNLYVDGSSLEMSGRAVNVDGEFVVLAEGNLEQLLITNSKIEIDNLSTVRVKNGTGVTL
ncbi:GIN domain-containing protein [Pseudobacteriovorax antillogorgiicola]|uniref:Putative auto-transporter adhesin head GIN domain-containing protein n=1 Tax=Pseudobacteriovorax antillogorgiicola TaxID=1513793 RepID=A0A1Y6CXH5_9BACT|nr:DUF2807 domain-containing protein [Pseudobacteriovorax antillogorgiicola]TCS40914.1 hypothetical protein EDD56_15213 [Pseudobacteriovorax antillogorgiicola]SMF84071.1 hypothetical protein SAMN06296036_1521 [Pseudobacteriovorax antillogorgiicola]